MTMSQIMKPVSPPFVSCPLCTILNYLMLYSLSNHFWLHLHASTLESMHLFPHLPPVHPPITSYSIPCLLPITQDISILTAYQDYGMFYCPVDLTMSPHSIKSSIKYLWTHFELKFDPSDLCSFHLVCPCSTCSSLITHTSQIPTHNAANSEC